MKKEIISDITVFLTAVRFPESRNVLLFFLNTALLPQTHPFLCLVEYGINGLETVSVN